MTDQLAAARAAKKAIEMLGAWEADRLYTLAEIKERTNLSERTIKREIGDGRITPVMIRGLFRVSGRELDRYFRVGSPKPPAIAATATN